MKRDLRIESYRAMAERSAQLAKEFDLPHVRQKHELAARTWLQLADIEANPAHSVVGATPRQVLTRA